MPLHPSDDFQLLAESAAAYELSHARPSEWEGSRFAGVRDSAPGAQGAFARNFLSDLAMRRGLAVERLSIHNQHYVVVEGRRVQVKLSTLWNSSVYRFQQIRDQDYDYVFALGLSPDDAHAWLIPKTDLLLHLEGVAGQHTGAAARETFWLEAAPGDRDPWLAQYGGTLASASELLEELA